MWKNIDGYPGYEVSDQGEIKGPRGIKKQQVCCGYYRLNLTVEGKKRNFFVHRLVATTFLGLCPAGKEVDHKNNIRTDNRAANLQYLTRSENMLKKPKKAGCALPYIGVCKDRNRWRSQAHVEKKQVYLGKFDTQEEAARARDQFYRDRGILVAFNFPI